MGVPKFFRWLSKKYPTILSGCAVMEPSATNPTGEFEARPFDNVYLDMNGILHNSAFGIVDIENATQQMHDNFVAKLETIFSAVRPVKLLFMALDGVAPRAKMNQQRTRRFMSRLTHSSAKKNAAPTVYINRPYHDSTSRDVAAMLPEDIIIKDQSTMPTFDFDSNCVTPGTDFMAQAAQWLHLFAQSKMRSGIWGPEVVIVVSDSSVPGEGEHKIIDWIRRQRSLVERTHLIYGADADLIFLGLALHVSNIHILREGSIPKSTKSNSGSSGRNSRFRGKTSKDTIFVSELHQHVTELELGQLFEPCGPIASVRIISEGHTKPKNFGFVRFGRVTASSGNADRELSEDEALEVERSVSRALLMNGHKLRGKAIGIDLARGSNQSPLSEAEQLKILEQQDLLTVEFMSLMGIEDMATALACLNLAQWDMSEAQVVYLEFASSNLPLDLYLETRNLLIAPKSPSTPSKLATLPKPTQAAFSPASPSNDAAFSPMSPTDPAINLDDNEKDAEKDDEPDEEEVVGINSPYVLVDLGELRTCFSNRFSRISISPDTGAPVDLEALKKVAYKPNVEKFVPATPSTTDSDPALPSVTITPDTQTTIANLMFKSFEVERVLDDFVLLGMLFGNDFLPSLPGQDIKTGSFNRLLMDYECVLVEEGYLTEHENFSLHGFVKVLDHVALREREIVRKKILSQRRHALQAKRKAERAEKNARNETPSETPSVETPSVVPESESDLPSPASSVPVTPAPGDAFVGPESPNAASPQKRPFQPRRRRPSKDRLEGESPTGFGPNAVGEDGAPVPLLAPKPRFWSGVKEEIPEPTESDHLARRVVYYQDNFPEVDFSAFSSDEEKLQHAKRTICVEYLRGISWVMRYYFRGCESWEWFYPHHYAPFAMDVAAQAREMMQNGASKSSDFFSFVLSEPFKPLEQLVAVLPPDSVMILPRSLRHLVTEAASPLFQFFPAALHIQKSDGISGAVAKWHGVLRLPFISKEILKKTMELETAKLDLADLAKNQFTANIAYFGSEHPLFEVCHSMPIGSLLANANAAEKRQSETQATSSAPSENDVLTSSQEIVDSMFQMPMKNVRRPAIASSNGPFTTLMFDVTPL